MKILLAYDGLHHSDAALEEAARLASTGGTVDVIGVVGPESRPTRSGHVDVAPHAHQDVAIARTFLKERGIGGEMLIEHGDPAEEILRVARDGGYDTIVTGTHGRGPVARRLLGSVSHELAERSPCTLLIASDDRVIRIEPRARASG